MKYVYLLQYFILYLQNQTFKFIDSKLYPNIKRCSPLGIIIKLFKITIICL